MLLSRDDSGSGSKTEQSVALLEQKWHVVSSKMEERKVSPQNTVQCVVVACNYHLISMRIFLRLVYYTRSYRIDSLRISFVLIILSFLPLNFYFPSMPSCIDGTSFYQYLPLLFIFFFPHLPVKTLLFDGGPCIHCYSDLCSYLKTRLCWNR